MRILVYENSAGFSSYTSKLCEALVKQPNVSIDYISIPNNSYLKNVDSHIIVVPILKDFDNSKKKTFLWVLNRITVSFANIIARNKYCKERKYDAISIQSTIAIVDQFFIKKFCKNNRYVVLTVHDVIPPIKSFYWSHRSLKKLYKTCHHLIVHTQANKEQLINEFGIPSDKISVIFHGTDVDYCNLDRNYCKRQIGLNQKKLTFLFYGLIREQKGLDILIEALKGIDDVQLFVAGAIPFGESFDRYDELIRNNGVDVFKIIHFIPEEMTDLIFNSCDCVCLPYKYFYSQSGVFMQSIKYRKPVIVSNVSSFGEYYSKYDIGFMCKPNDVTDLHLKLVAAVSVLRNNPQFFMEGLNRAANDNSWDASAKKYIEVLHYGQDSFVENC